MYMYVFFLGKLNQVNNDLDFLTVSREWLWCRAWITRERGHVHITLNERPLIMQGLSVVWLIHMLSY